MNFKAFSTNKLSKCVVLCMFIGGDGLDDSKRKEKRQKIKKENERSGKVKFSKTI